MLWLSFDLQLFPWSRTVIFPRKYKLHGFSYHYFRRGINFASFQQMAARGFPCTIGNSDVDVGTLDAQSATQTYDFKMAFSDTTFLLVGKTNFVVGQASCAGGYPSCLDIILIYEFL